MKVVVVGGGVVGLCVAYFLRRAGLDVVVVDRGRCGYGTSYGNAGWITRFHAPFPTPGVVLQAVRWTVRGDGPFRFRPRADPALAVWLWRFLRVAASRTHLERARALLALGGRTFELWDDLAEIGVRFAAPANGVVLACLSPRELAHQIEELEDLRRAGYADPVDILDRDAVLELEPALSDRVAGGLFVRLDRAVSPGQATSALAAWLTDNGVDVREQTEVAGIRRSGAGWSVETPGDTLAADAVVVAAGTESRALLAPLGARLPIESAKGYSVLVTGRGSPPRRPVGLMDVKVPYTPFGDRARLTGFLELGAVDAAVPESRIDEIVRGAAAYFRDWRPERRLERWAGFRPLTPDGLPFVGPLPGRDGLYVAAGHGTLGVTLAPSTGEALARVVAGEPAPEALLPFRADRPLSPAVARSVVRQAAP